MSKITKAVRISNAKKVIAKAKRYVEYGRLLKSLADNELDDIDGVSSLSDSRLSKLLARAKKLKNALISGRIN